MKDLPYWVAFNHLPGIGPVRFQKIIAIDFSNSHWHKGSLAIRLRISIRHGEESALKIRSTITFTCLFLYCNILQ
jgi:hypothetical protein